MAEKEYIERGALKHLFYERYHTAFIQEKTRENPEYWHGVCTGINWGVNTILDAPAADVAPVVHAEWKDNHCTACGMMPMGEELWDSCDFAPPKFEFFMDFCPSCGAKMDGGKAE